MQWYIKNLLNQYLTEYKTKNRFIFDIGVIHQYTYSCQSKFYYIYGMKGSTKIFIQCGLQYVLE